ncbi:MAG: TatD family hydrolase [Pigmentiphaga sp.]
MLFDSHCHLDAPEFDVDRDAVIADAHAAGVSAILLPAVAPSNFAAVRRLAWQLPGGVYALGIHPLFVQEVGDDALDDLRAALELHRDDPRLVAVGEIGLDRFVPEIAQGEAWERQWRFFHRQLTLAAEFGLPAVMHVRRSVDLVLKGLRQVGEVGGIAHAFNGSRQQADQLIERGVALGIGGAMTYPRALQIRRLAAAIPLQHLVLETDSPDIPPAWLHEPNRRNTPAEVLGVAHALAELRQLSVEEIVQSTGASACAHLPRLASAVGRKP